MKKLAQTYLQLTGVAVAVVDVKKEWGVMIDQDEYENMVVVDAEEQEEHDDVVIELGDAVADKVIQ